MSLKPARRWPCVTSSTAYLSAGSSSLHPIGTGDERKLDRHFPAGPYRCGESGVLARTSGNDRHPVGWKLRLKRGCVLHWGREPRVPFLRGRQYDRHRLAVEPPHHRVWLSRQEGEEEVVDCLGAPLLQKRLALCLRPARARPRPPDARECEGRPMGGRGQTTSAAGSSFRRIRRMTTPAPDSGFPA